jgi:hypothetical protein
MSNLKNKLQHLVEGQIPEFLRVSYPRFASFIKEYYTFLDENRQANAVLLNSNTWSDVDLTLDMFAAEMRKQHAYDISPEALVEERRLIKFINQYYEAKGTENAAELYFRMMYNDTATIKYPGDFVLRASDGVWSSKKTIKIDTNYSDTIINPSALELAPAPIREDADDAFSLKEKTVYLKYYRRESTGLKLYSYELGCIQVGKIITNKDIFELEVDVPRTTNIENFNEILSTQPYLDTVWVTAFEDDVEYVYGFLTQQLIGYNILSGGEGFRLRDTFVVEVEETPFYPITTQQNNNGIVRVTGLTTSDVEEYFASDYVVSGSEYAASDTRGIINNFNFISTGHRFDVTGDYFAELYMDDDSYTTYKDFTRRFENPRGSRFSTLVTGDYFAEREGVTAYMEFNDENGYTDFNEDVFNISTSSVEFQVGYVYEHPGEWKNNAGFISDVNKLQDNYYYQAYSYVVQTKNTPYEVWGDLYNNSAHPAGFAVFGELLIENEIRFTPVDITSRQFIVNNFNETLKPVDRLAKNVIKPTEDGVSVGNSYAPEYFLEIYTEGEEVTYAFNKVLDDAVGVGDLTGLSLNTQPVFGDIALTGDEVSKSVTLPNVTDTVAITDEALITLVYNRTNDDMVVVEDSQQISVGPNFNETIILSDDSQFTFEKNNIVENLVATDEVVKDINLVFDFIDTYSPSYFAEDYVSENLLSINDQIAIQPNYGLTEDSQVSDEVIGVFTKNVTEQLNVVDDSSITLEKTFTDNIVVSDISSINFIVEYSDEVVLTDNALPLISVPQEDATAVDDVVSASVVKNISDETFISDEISEKSVETVKTETVSISDVNVVDFNKIPSELVNTEDAVQTISLIKNITENIVAVDVLNIEKTFSVSDSITQTDDDSKHVDKIIVSAYGEDYFECPSYAGDDILTLTDSIFVAVDNYVAAEYVDFGYAGEVSENTDTTNQC